MGQKLIMFVYQQTNMRPKKDIQHRSTEQLRIHRLTEARLSCADLRHARLEQAQQGRLGRQAKKFNSPNFLSDIHTRNSKKAENCISS